MILNPSESAMTLKEELELVKKAQENITGFDRLYAYYFPRIYTYCLNRVSSREVAEDITGQVFVSALESLMSFDIDKGNKFGTWLYRVTHNKIVDYFRKKKSILFSLLSNEPSSVHDYDEELDLSDRQKETAEVLKTLKPRYQQIISLKFYSEFDNQEIADTVGIPKSNVALVLHRALKSFKKSFQKLYPESEIFDLN